VAKSRKNANLKVSDPFEPLKAGASCPQTSSVLQNAELDRNTLTAVEHVGNGEFGEVYLANQVVDRTELNGQLVEVEERRAVKTLKPKLPEHCARTFTSEARVHLDFKHENIVKCLGVCMAQQPFLVVLEYCMYGDLKKVLTACKDRELEVRGTEFVSFGRQIADAFAYLTAMRIVHMDLATRNVLVGKGGMLKVADFGLAQTYNKGSDGWKLAGKLRLPFLWVPPECLPEKLWNPKMVEYEPIFNEQVCVSVCRACVCACVRGSDMHA
jgi:serine/threonine protein kinase